jgi:hypothetical protein
MTTLTGARQRRLHLTKALSIAPTRMFRRVCQLCEGRVLEGRAWIIVGQVLGVDFTGIVCDLCAQRAQQVNSPQPTVTRLA